MHASSLENMLRCYRDYVANGPLEVQAETVVLDVGSADVNGSYRQVFKDSRYRYLGADMEPGPGVDIVLSDPYQLPLVNGSVDLVISGQAFEHCEFFWLLFQEMVRVLRPEGLIFLIAPSAGPIHRYPVDCYRFYPDSFAALAKFAGCILVESWLDERGPWRDLVGVFRRAGSSPLQPRALPARQPPIEWNNAPGSPEEEAIGGKVSYLRVLEQLHRELSPVSYLEIGVQRGASLELAQCPAIGVDPSPDINRELPSTTIVLALTSDDFFSRHAEGVTPDLSFIDGMHLFEYALRDFMNVERRAAPGAVVVLDGVLPNHPAQARRDRQTREWTGDIWRVADVLKRRRSDLFVLPIDAAPAGLLLVAGLDQANRVLWDHYNPIVREAAAEARPPPEVIARLEAVDPAGPVFRQVLDALKAARADHCLPHQIVARIREALPDPTQAESAR